jgi:hypothetical protein
MSCPFPSLSGREVESRGRGQVLRSRDPGPKRSAGRPGAKPGDREIMVKRTRLSPLSETSNKNRFFAWIFLGKIWIPVIQVGNLLLQRVGAPWT